MKLDQANILGELERLGAALPWDTVQLWIKRTPEGKISFTCYIEDNHKFGMSSVFGSGNTLQEAIDDGIKCAGLRDPEKAREDKIAEMEEKIRKLRAVEIGLPPYRPNRELAAGYVTTPDPVVDIPATPTEPLCEGTRLAIEGERA